MISGRYCWLSKADKNMIEMPRLYWDGSRDLSRSTGSFPTQATWATSGKTSGSLGSSVALRIANPRKACPPNAAFCLPPLDRRNSTARLAITLTSSLSGS